MMMKRAIGFFPDRTESEIPETVSSFPARVDTPVKSLVKIRFEDHPIELAYYNDLFDLRPGDVVYVSGKKAGCAGTVTSVTTKFRIRTSDYERVLSLLDLTVHGHYARMKDKMVSFDDAAISAEQFESWVTPPEDPKAKKDPDWEEEEIISGEGYTMDLNNLGACEDLTDSIAQRASLYCSERRVRYLQVRGGRGCAFVEGGRWYRVDFNLDGGMITDLYCDCPYPGLCKHGVAAALNLRMLMHQPQMQTMSRFTALDRSLFWKLASRAEEIEL